MKKVLGIAIVALLAVTVVQAEDSEPGAFGIGYQGAFMDQGYTMNQIALRFAPQPIGGALVIGQMSEFEEDDPKTYEETTTAWTLQGKFFYSLIERQNSDFYIGGLFGFGYYDYEDKPTSGGGTTYTDEEVSFILGFLAGVEWRFAELPELGFNFELGYNVEFMNEESGSTTKRERDSVFAGTSVSLGATYYF